MSVDDEKNKEESEFNAAQQNAVEKAVSLPEALYGNLDVEEISNSVDGISITSKEESYTGNEDGDVVVNSDTSSGDKEYFPSQLKVADIVEIIKNGAEKMPLMVERGVNPKTTSPEKLKQYLFGDESGSAQVYEGQEMTEANYVDMLIQQYTELWDEAEERKKTASETLKNVAKDRAKIDEKAVETTRGTIAKIPEKPSETVVTNEEPPAPPKRGFLGKFFGKK